MAAVVPVRDVGGPERKGWGRDSALSPGRFGWPDARGGSGFVRYSEVDPFGIISTAKITRIF